LRHFFEAELQRDDFGTRMQRETTAHRVEGTMPLA